MLEFMTHPITIIMIACAVTIALYHLYIHVYESAYKLGRSVGRKEILKENIVRANKRPSDMADFEAAMKLVRCD